MGYCVDRRSRTSRFFNKKATLKERRFLMEITVSVRHFTLSNEIRDYAKSAIEGAFAEFRLKISHADIVLDMQRNLVSASLSVAIKENPVSAASTAYDNVYKAIDEAVEKAATQARKYLDKKQDHKGTGLKDSELKKSES